MARHVRDERNGDPAGDTAVFNRRFVEAAWNVGRRNIKAIASAIGGTAFGAASAYLAIWLQVSDARHAAHDAAAAAAELKETVAHLVTQRELDLANSRIAELERQMNQAAQHANDAPVPRPKR